MEDTYNENVDQIALISVYLRKNEKEKKKIMKENADRELELEWQEAFSESVPSWGPHLQWVCRARGSNLLWCKK